VHNTNSGILGKKKQMGKTSMTRKQELSV